MHLINYLFSFLILLFSLSGINSDLCTPDKTKVQPRTIEITGIDKMKFVVEANKPGVVVGDSIKTVNGETYRILEAIKVKPGQEVTLKLNTKSNLPPRSMSHNWVLLKQEADPAAFDKEAVLAVENNYIPPLKENEIIANTGLASGGETVSVTFTTPEKQGMYDYLCSFPGHFANDMRGKLIVQK